MKHRFGGFDYAAAASGEFPKRFFLRFRLGGILLSDNLFPAEMLPPSFSHLSTTFFFSFFLEI